MDKTRKYSNINYAGKIQSGISSFANGVLDLIEDNKTIIRKVCAICDCGLSEEYKFCPKCGREIVEVTYEAQ